MSEAARHGLKRFGLTAAVPPRCWSLDYYGEQRAGKGLRPLFVRAAIENQFDHESLLTDTFVLDSAEFQHHAAYATVELDQGAILTAPADRFNDCFTRDLIPSVDNQERYRFTTEGQIVDEHIKSRR